MNNAVLTLSETAAILRISLTGAYRLVHEDKLPAFRMGPHGTYRVLRSELTRWIEERSKETDRCQLQRM